jgi:myo-inositol-1(or 4)-monophosphatase
VNDLVTTARAAADAAVAIHRRDAGRVRIAASRTKARADYVSRTDLDAQRAALDVIRARYPEHAVLAEESEEPVADQLARWDGRPMWIVDPLDGTANFLHDHPWYSASVAVAVEGSVTAGVVACGTTGERWWAVAGRGAYKNGRRIGVSSDRPIIEALVGTGFPFKALELLPGYLGQFERVLRSASGIRRAGSAALDLCYLAQGSLDAFWEEVLMPWDFAAGLVLVSEAGGTLARPDGASVDLTPGPVYAANSEPLLEALMEVLAG